MITTAQLPWVDDVALLDTNVRGRENSFGMLVMKGEASVPASILLQDMNHISKPQGEIGVGGLGLIAVGNCKGEHLT